jgi:uncharacterized protein (UPF0335 family)
MLMVSEVSNLNLDKVDGEINTILSDIKNIFGEAQSPVKSDDLKVDQKQVADITKKLMQVF